MVEFLAMTELGSPDRFAHLTPEDRREIALGFLEDLTPGFQRLDVFTQLARLAGLDTVEVVPVRPQAGASGGAEVLLARRSMDEPFWPGLLHVAGACVLESDPIEHEHDFGPALRRTMKEFGSDLTFTHGPVELETVHRRGKRSREVTIRYWGEVAGEPAKGEFFDINDVLRRAPELGITKSHTALIQKVADHYNTYRLGQEA